MENMDNNMEDFFKKQFNRFDKPFEDWEKPDAGDWEAITSQVPVFQQTSFWTWSNIGLVTLSAVLVSSLIYVWVLKKEITILEKTVEVQQEQIEQVEQSVLVIEKRFIDEQKTIEIKQQNLIKQNQAIIQQNEFLNSVVKEQKQIISDFSIVLDSLKTTDFSNTIQKQVQDKSSLNSAKQFSRNIPIANTKNDNQSNK